MPGSVKNRIRGGTIFLFLLVMLSAGFSIYFLARNRQQSKNILKANYESLEYCHRMQTALDSIHLGKTAFIDSFETKLRLQESNITEPGENAATQALRNSFNQLKTRNATLGNESSINFQLQSILQLNMTAIKNKNEKAEASAENAMTYLVMIASVIFLVGLTFVYNFPSIITSPIQKLTGAIKQIGSKNYSQRIRIDSKDEFGQLADAFNDMAERLEYFENSNLNILMFEKSRAEAVINSLKDASIGIDKNNIILFANHQALQLLGLKAEDVIRKSIDELSTRNDLFRFLIENETTTPFKIVIDNRENYFVKEVIEIDQAESKNRMIVLKNITSFKELDVAKTNFIATISHELKTPLASSDFSLKLLEDERVSKLSPEQKELIENLKQDNQRMLKILSELLNMSQVESGRIQLNVQKVNPARIIINAIEAVLGSAKEKGIIIRDHSVKNLPDIEADADKTTWVLNNFLTNAIKYSFNNGSIEVKVEQQNGHIIFSVTDHGSGIGKEYLPRLFERYFQVPGSKEKGSGLGLAISKEFVEAQKGKVWVESELGKGSTFKFQLPVGNQASSE